MRIVSDWQTHTHWESKAKPS